MFALTGWPARKSAVALPACGGGTPVTRGFDSHQVLQIRDSTFFFNGGFGSTSWRRSPSATCNDRHPTVIGLRTRHPPRESRVIASRSALSKQLSSVLRSTRMVSASVRTL